MFHYKLYGMHIVSDFELKQLTNLSGTESDLLPQITIQEKELPKELKREQDCYFVIAKEKSYISNSYCYLLMENGEKLFYEKKENVTPQLLNAYLLGWGIATLVYQRGELAIHCSCVKKDGRAILISGNSGSGKSTVTNELLKRGYSFMADDMSVVKMIEEEVIATAAFPYQKLCSDAALACGMPYEEMIYVDEDKDKFLVPCKDIFEDEPVPVKAMVILTRTKEDRINVQELIGADKFRACMDSLFLSPLLGEDLYKPENGVRVMKFASRIPLYQISRPVGRNTKEEIMEEILKIL